MNSSDGGQYPTGLKRLLITAPTMVGVTLVALDMTIANVALPHMQSSLSASQEQVFWVLTSYLVATAIATPLSGWLANRFGRKAVMLTSISGFTAASMLCGAAGDLQTIVMARILQGAFGAALMPLTQAILLDINPPRNHTKAMAIFSMGSLLGPMIGPTLGGYLTDLISWRWVFFINVPFGILAAAGIMTWKSEPAEGHSTRFDLFGFGTVAVALAAIQLMLDRGEQVGWFDSAEIQAYAVIGALAVYLAVVHTATTRDGFINVGMFRDRNFSLGCFNSTLMGVANFTLVPITVVMMQTLLGYSAFHTGLLSIPRGLGSWAGMVLVMFLAARMDQRLIMLLGLLALSAGQIIYAGIDLYVDEYTLVVGGVIQGLASGLFMVPLSALAYATLASSYRNEASAMFALMRNVGSAVGISLLNRDMAHVAAASRSHMAEGVRPDNPVMDFAMPDFDFGAADALTRMNLEIARQASMVATVHLYWLTLVIALLVAPTVLLMRLSKGRKGESAMPVME